MSKQTMKGIIYQGPNKISVEEVPVPVPNEDEVLIKVSHAGICGSDLYIYSGTHPRATAPLIIGHEFSGTIVQGNGHIKEGEHVTVYPLISCGKCYTCKTGNSYVCEALGLYGIDAPGGMAEYVKVPADVIIPVPENIDLKTAALIEPIAVTVHAVKRAGAKAEDTAVVFGAGPIGLMLSAVLKVLGLKKILVVEMNPYRLQVAKELGFTVIDSKNEDPIKVIKEHTDGVGADVVFDCAAHPSVAAILTQAVRVKGTIEIVGSYKKPAEFPLLDIEFKELTIVGTRVYEKEDFEKAVELLESDFPFEKLITHVYKVEYAQDGFDILTSGGDAIKVLFSFE